jgi:hypothetical protein
MSLPASPSLALTNPFYNSHYTNRYSVWSDLGFLPEEMDSLQWLKGDANMHGYYPLRPELIESTYHQYRTTRDRSWLVAGEVFLDSLERLTPTPCGFASVGNLQVRVC